MHKAISSQHGAAAARDAKEVNLINHKDEPKVTAVFKMGNVQKVEL